MTEPGPPAQEAPDKMYPLWPQERNTNVLFMLFLFFNLLFLAAPGSMWDLSFPTRSNPWHLAMAAWSLNH